MKKRAIWIAVSALLLIASLALCLAACNDNRGDGRGGSAPAGDRLDSDMTTDELTEMLCGAKNYTITWKGFSLENGVKKYDDDVITFAIDNTDVHFNETSDDYSDEWYSFVKDGKVYIYYCNTSEVFELKEDVSGNALEINDADYGWFDFDEYFAEDYGVAVDCSVYIGYEAEVGQNEAMGMCVLTAYFQFFRAIDEGIIYHDGNKLVSRDEEFVIECDGNKMTFTFPARYAHYIDVGELDYLEIAVASVNGTNVEVPQQVIAE